MDIWVVSNFGLLTNNATMKTNEQTNKQTLLKSHFSPVPEQLAA